MKIYTTTGDKGTTSLVGGKRVSKTHPRLEAYGTVDELNSWIGLVAATANGEEPGLPPEDASLLQWIQNKLFDLGAQLATEPESTWQPRRITCDDVATLEAAIDRIDATLPAHNQFLLPGGTQASAQAQVARTVARRAERRMLSMDSPEEPLAADALRFMNRLSDLLFVLARHLNHLAGQPDIPWTQD